MEVSKNLIRLCRKGDRRAQNVLYEMCYDILYSICRRYEKNEEDARHVVNLGFLKIVTSLDKLPKGANFEHWMRRIMINTNIDEYRKNKRRKETMSYQDIEEGSVGDHERFELNASELKFSSEELEYMIRELPETWQKVFNLYAIDGYSHKEISDMLNMPVGTSKSTLSKARSRLKEWILEKQNTPKVNIS